MIKVNDRGKLEQQLRLDKLSDKTISIYLNYFDRFISNSFIINQESIDNFLINTRYKTTRDGNNNVKRAFLKTLIHFYKLNILNYDLHKPKGRKEEKLHTFLKPSDIDFLIRNLPFEYGIMIQVFTETGLRLNELANVKKKDIDLINKTIVGIGKGRKWFELYISQETADVLNYYIENLNDDDYVFSDGKIKNRAHKIWRKLKEECKKLGYHDFHPHLLRHYLGWKLRVIHKMDLIQIKDMLRHSSVDTTQIYAKADKSEIKQKWSEVLNKKQNN